MWCADSHGQRHKGRNSALTMKREVQIDGRTSVIVDKNHNQIFSTWNTFTRDTILFKKVDLTQASFRAHLPMSRILYLPGNVTLVWTIHQMMQLQWCLKETWPNKVFFGIQGHSRAGGFDSEASCRDEFIQSLFEIFFSEGKHQLCLCLCIFCFLIH